MPDEWLNPEEGAEAAHCPLLEDPAHSSSAWNTFGNIFES